MYILNKIIITAVWISAMSIVTAEGLNSSESQPSSGLHAKGPEAKELIEISAFIHKHTYMHTNNSCFTLKCIIFQS